MSVPLASCQRPVRSTASRIGDSDEGLIGYWKLRTDSQDYSGHGHHGVNHSVTFGPAGPHGSSAAEFKGQGQYIEVPRTDAIDFAAGDFTISVWVRCKTPMTDVPGDILNKYDPATRRGLNLHITGSSPAYSSISDVRNVHFGIDNARMGIWIDHGRPSATNTLISTLIVFRGELYAGIADAARPEDACRVYRFAGGRKWVDCGRLGSDPSCHSVMSMLIHRDRLYAGNGTWDWVAVNQGQTGQAHVFRYEGGAQWHDLGAIDDARRATSLASFNDDLYVADDRMHVFRLNRDGTWEMLKQSSAKVDRIDSMMLYRGRLFGSRTYPWLYQGGTEWLRIGDLVDSLQISQIHSMVVYGGRLYLGGWPSGRIMRYGEPGKWTECGIVGIDPKLVCNEINDFAVYNGKLYAGVIPRSQVWRYEGGKDWTLIRQIVNNPHWDAGDRETWNRVPCMAIFQGRLFLGASTCRGYADASDNTEAGHVFSWQAGQCVSYDHDLGGDWSHLAAVREGPHLKLYVNGRLAAVSPSFAPADFDISNRQPLMIGFGAENYFNGRMCELRVYRRALVGRDIEDLWRRPMGGR